MAKDDLKKIKEKINLFNQDKEVASFMQSAEIAGALSVLAETLQSARIEIKGDKGDRGDDGYTPIKGKDYFDGKDGYTPIKGKDYFDGNNYILTTKDKKEIAKNIKVPVVEKEVKTIEIIKEQPIIKEVAIRETAKEIGDKINSLSNYIEISTIKDHKKLLEKAVVTSYKKHGGSTINNLVAGTNITIDNSDPRNPVINSTGGGGGHTIQDEGTPLTQRTNLNFVGAGVTVTDDAGNDATVVTITSGSGDALTSGGLTQFLGNNNWKVFYSDGSGDTQELSLGTSGQYLKSNGATSAPSWDTPVSGGTPGGSDTQLQFNDAGSFGGVDTYTWDNTNKKLTATITSDKPAFEIKTGGNIVNVGALKLWDNTTNGNDKVLSIGNGLAFTNTIDIYADGYVDVVKGSGIAYDAHIQGATTTAFNAGRLASGAGNSSSVTGLFLASSAENDSNLYGFFSNMGTTNVGGMLLKGTGGSGTVEVGKHLTIWGNTAGNSNKGISIGNGTSFNETFYVRNDGVIGAGTWSGSTIAVDKGGTGQSTYTDGQLLIGNTSGNTLTKATLTAGTGIAITNGNGSITITNTGTNIDAFAETPSGTVNSSNVTFTLANTPADTDGVIVLLDGVTQYNGIDYTVSGTTITFTTAPVTGSSIFAYYNVLSGLSLPTVATGSEVDTGTNDTKFVSPKAIADSHNVPNVVPGTAGNVMTSDGTDWISSAPSGGASTPSMNFSTVFETLARFGGTTSGSGSVRSVDSNGLNLSTGNSSLGYANNYIPFPALGSSGTEVGSPSFSTSLGFFPGTDVWFYFGIGYSADIGTGTGDGYTGKHIGIKITRASSGNTVVTATQADGSTENTSTLISNFTGNYLDLIIKVNGTTSVDYYYRIDGGALSSATNLTSNIPSGVQGQLLHFIKNKTVTSNSDAYIVSMSYNR